MNSIGSNNLKFIGITGTNGKTTTASLIYHLLKKLNQPVALIATVKYVIGSQNIPATYTTPPDFILKDLMKKIKKAKCRYVVMEASSHGLYQDRVKSIRFKRCVFTNLTQDHLDYHKTMKNYFAAKRKLFTNNKKALSFINIDDNYGRRLSKVVTNKRTYGIDRPCDLRASEIKLSETGSAFNLNFSGESYNLRTKLLGRHNILNTLAAAGVVNSLGFSMNDIKKHLVSFGGAKGRLQKAGEDIFVDYAHTPDALENALSSLREVGYQKIITVFGCGGDRDKSKRGPMGQIASQLADFTFITSDNSRSEDPESICLQIKKGFKGKNFSIVADRKKAILEGLKLFKDYSKKGFRCCLLVAGKGHENYQIIGNKRISFNDSKVIKQFIPLENTL